MAKQMPSVTLAVPYIFRPIQLKQIASADIPSVGSLSQLISRAQRKRFVASRAIDTYFQLFRINPNMAPLLPYAALTYLADFNCQPDGWVMRVDPVHLHVERDHLVLADNHVLSISEEEADLFISQINKTFDDQPWQIIKGSASRWYIQLDGDPAIRTHMLDDVVSKSIDPYLLAGENRAHWQSLMNEIQMFMHSHSLNFTRTTKGLLPVNSLWFWGEGSLNSIDQFKHAKYWNRVYANDSLNRGLAMFTEHELLELPDNYIEIESSLSHNERQLIILNNFHTCSKYGDINEWQTSLQQFEEQWAKPILKSLSNGDLDQLELVDGTGRCYRINRQLLNRWWRRTRPLQQCI